MNDNLQRCPDLVRGHAVVVAILEIYPAAASAMQCDNLQRCLDFVGGMPVVVVTLETYPASASAVHVCHCESSVLLYERRPSAAQFAVRYMLRTFAFCPHFLVGREAR